MKVSIIIPVFNKIEIVEECIKLNIIHSNYENEWIIIDNNSNDTTKQGLQRLKQFAQSKNHSFEIITEIENTGVAKAWNKGLRYAKHEYICVLNNDCVMMPGWDEGLISSLDKFGLTFCAPFVIEMMLNKSYSIDEFMNGEKNWKYILNRNLGKVKYGLFGGVVIFGKNVSFQKVGFFDEQFYLSLEEMDYLWRAMQMEMKIGTVGDVIAQHNTGSTRKSVNFDHNYNLSLFLKKWGWHFEKNENNLINKKIKSWNKFLLSHFYIMGTLNPFTKRFFS